MGPEGGGMVNMEEEQREDGNVKCVVFLNSATFCQHFTSYHIIRVKNFNHVQPLR